MEKETIEFRRSLRRDILFKRDSLTEEQQRRAAFLITERILGHQWFYGSDILLGFVNFGSEISTDAILQEALRKGKAVYVPRVEGKEMIFRRIYSFAELEAGYRGIREPGEDAPEFTYDAALTDRILMLMPGVAFDGARNRMGYGGGYYDRYLAKKEALTLRTIGIGHGCQLIDSVPVQDWDIKPYQVICV